MSASTLGAVDERPCFIPIAEEHLFGMVTVPRRPPTGVGVIVLPGAGPGGSTHRSGLFVRMGRDLAALGFLTLRFDWHGIGDSTGPTDRFQLDRPFVDDLAAARAWLGDTYGVERVAVVASCFGARTALAATPSLGGLEALLLFAPPIRDRGFAGAAIAGAAARGAARPIAHVLRNPRLMLGLSDARRRRTLRRFLRHAIRNRLSGNGSEGSDELGWVSPHLLQHLEAVVEAGIPTTLAYGEGDDYHRDLLKAMDGPLGDTIERGHVEIETISPYAIHSFDRVDVQEATLAKVRAWAKRYPVVTHPDPRHDPDSSGSTGKGRHEG
jgi:alpha/beta superfamily hydrolase